MIVEIKALNVFVNSSNLILAINGIINIAIIAIRYSIIANSDNFIGLYIFSGNELLIIDKKISANCNYLGTMTNLIALKGFKKLTEY